MVSCKFDGDCLKDVKFKTLANIRGQFWGKVPNRYQRRDKIRNIMSEARREFNRRCVNNDVDTSLFPN